jgi:nucleoside-diphosphate-sugar epimerase
LNIFITGANGFIGGSIAAGLVRAGHHVTGLIRKPEQAAELERLGIVPVTGSLDDRDLLIAQANAADAVVNAASSDHHGAVEALIEGLAGSNKPFLHTSGSSIVGDASGGEAGAAAIYREDTLPEPTADKAARMAIDRLVLDAAKRGVRSAVLCNTLIYGHGAIKGSASVQLPRCDTSAAAAISGRTSTSTTSSNSIVSRSRKPLLARSISSKAAKRRSAK